MTTTARLINHTCHIEVRSTGILFASYVLVYALCAREFISLKFIFLTILFPPFLPFRIALAFFNMTGKHTHTQCEMRYIPRSFTLQAFHFVDVHRRSRFREIKKEKKKRKEGGKHISLHDGGKMRGQQYRRLKFSLMPSHSWVSHAFCETINCAEAE